MEWLVVLDPVDGLISRTDTSLALIRAARDRGIAVDTATIDRLYFQQQAAVLATDVAGAQRDRQLAGYDLILMRKEPPYDLAFHYATQLLSLAGCPVVNSPEALRSFNEKMIALQFSQFMPPTLVSSDCSRIAAFVEAQGDCVIKALDSFQGQSVRLLAPRDYEVVRSYTGRGRQPVMVQKFQEQVFEGDKRVIMLGERFLGAVMRRPKKGYHANFANSEALATELTDQEQTIVETLGPWLVKNGIHFAGFDLIGEHLTEINLTCPTGIVQISELENRPLAEEIVDYLVALAV